MQLQWQAVLMPAARAHPQHLPDHGPLFCIAQVRLKQRQYFQLLPPHVFAKRAPHSIGGHCQLMCELRRFCSTAPKQKSQECQCQCIQYKAARKMIASQTSCCRVKRRLAHAHLANAFTSANRRPTLSNSAASLS